MVDKSPYPWKPNEILEVTNVTDRNMIFEKRRSRGPAPGVPRRQGRARESSS